MSVQAHENGREDLYDGLLSDNRRPGDIAKSLRVACYVRSLPESLNKRR
jgi:hypothetical protein